MTAALMSARPGAMQARLRAVTRPAHDRLHHVSQLSEATLTLPAYLASLARLYGFWRNWEPRAGALLDDNDFVQPRRRLDLLRDDLIDLGLTETGIDVLPRCAPADLTGAAEALGSFYVMEGSRLGGRVIQQDATRRLGLTEARGCRYFTGYGRQTGPMWQTFLDRLEATSMADAPAVERGAVATFDGLTGWLMEPLAL